MREQAPGLGRPGRERIDPHVVRGEVERHRFRELDHRRLAGHIGGPVGDDDAAELRGDVDHAAAAGGDDLRDRVFAHQEDAGQVDPHRALPVGEVEIDDVADRLADRGPVHQDVDRTERVDGGGDRVGGGVRIGDVAILRPRRAALRGDVGGGLLRAFAVDVADQHRGALGGETPRRGAGDAARGRRDHRYFSVQPAHRPAPSLCCEECAEAGRR